MEEHVQRRLAVILAADVVGYSALMERADEATYAEIGRLRREVVDPGLRRYQGRLIKTTGDGIFAEFASPVSAVRCAAEIQDQLASAAGPIRLRIGINLGDVIVDDQGDLYGDGINIAARLEALADPGGILISGKVHGEVDGKLDAAFEDRGEQQLKNISKPVHAYAVRAGAHTAITERLSAAPPLPDKPSIELDPRFGFVAALAGACHMQNVTLGHAVDPQFERKEAVRLLRSALSIDDGDPDTLAFASVISAYMVGDYESAIEMADRAVALNPNSFFAWNNRGWVYRNAGLPEEAVRSFERATRVSPVDPQLPITFVGMGFAFIELRRFDEAILLGKKAQRQNPSYSGAYRCLASAFAHLERDTEAREAAARLLEVDPAFTVSAWIARGGQSNAKRLTEGLRKAGLPE